jgi:acetyl esterase/lipase
MNRFLLSAVLLLLTMALMTSCFRASRRLRDVAYVAETAPDFHNERHRLDLYMPKRRAGTPRPIVVFIHGGSWDSGRKNLYSFVGRRLAGRGYVAAVINYRLAPEVRVPAMADDCARAVGYLARTAGTYGGDASRLFLMGHSAGGGLAALLATNDSLFTRLGVPNPVRGALLDDPAGLDMYEYLRKREYPDDARYLVPFGTDPAVWRRVSALYHVGPKTPPLRVFIGGRTYPSIRDSSERFAKRLREAGVPSSLTVIPRKTHFGMVTQLFWGSNRLYDALDQLVGADGR